MDLARRLRPLDPRHHAAGIADRHRHRLDDRRDGDRRHGALHRRRHRHHLRRALALSSSPATAHGHTAKPSRVAGSFWGLVAGFTSFVAHVGGPPFQVYALPLRMDPKVFTGTATIFFAITNAIKLVPYFLLGQFDTTSLAASAVLMPAAPLATLAGAG